MITSIDNETLNFLCKHELTFNQFCMCLLIHERNGAKIIKYISEVGFLTGGTIVKTNNREVNELNDLVERGYIKYTWKVKHDKHHLDNYSVTEKFTKGFLDKFKEAVKELWDTYPTYMLINGQEMPYGKSDYEAFEEQYTKMLKVDISLHTTIMQDVLDNKKYSKYAPVKLSNYLSSRLWEGKSNAKPKIRIH